MAQPTRRDIGQERRISPRHARKSPALRVPVDPPTRPFPPITACWFLSWPRFASTHWRCINSNKMGKKTWNNVAVPPCCNSSGKIKKNKAFCLIHGLNFVWLLHKILFSASPAAVHQPRGCRTCATHHADPGAGESEAVHPEFAGPHSSHGASAHLAKPWLSLLFC